MDKQILNFTANEQALTVDEPIKISTNKVNYIQAHFDLGQNWQGYDSIRAIWFNDFQTISTVLDSQGVTSVPFEVMKRKGCVKVNLVGSISEDDVLTDRLTSYPVVAVIVDCTAQITGANTQPITPSEYEQFVAAVHEDAERAEAGATASEQSAQNASDSATSAHNSAESAHDDKIAIEQAIAEVIQQIEDFEQVQVVVNTLPPSSQATSDFTDGVLTLGIPQGVKGDTGNGIQSIAKTGTSGLVDTYTITFTNGQTTTFTVTNGETGATPNISIGTVTTLDPDESATATISGTAEEPILSFGIPKGDTGEVSLSELEDATIVQTLSDTEPYHFRRTNNGQGAGHREYDEIVGASVGWNQLLQNGNFADGTTGWTGTTYVTLTVSSGVLSISTTANSNRTWGAYTSANIIGGHKYMALGGIRRDYTGTDVDANIHKISFRGNESEMVKSISTPSVGTYSLDCIVAPTVSNTEMVIHTNGSIQSSSSGTDFFSIWDVQLIDLTLMLGSTIADYAYSLEQSTAGSGVAWLKTHFPRLFDNGYQPYDSGSIKSVSGLTAHEMVGFNLWDEEWRNGYYSASGGFVAHANYMCDRNGVRVIPNETYYFKCPSVRFEILGYGNTPSGADYKRRINANIQNSTFTVPSDVHWIRFSNYSSGTVTTYNHDICINLSDTSINGQYFPYEKHTYPLDSSVTLRGKYVLDNGQLKAVGDVWKSDGTVTRNFGVVDLGSLNWSTSDGFFESRINDRSNGGAVCAKYEFYGTVQYPTIKANLQEKQFAFTSNSAYKYIEVKDSTYSSASDFKTAMSGVYLVYELATPTTESATAYDSPQWCDANGTEEYVGSELPVGHNTTYPMSLVDTMPTTNGTFEPRVTVTNGVRTVTWVSV